MPAKVPDGLVPHRIPERRHTDQRFPPAALLSSAVDKALNMVGKPVTGARNAKSVDDLFQTDSGKKAKGEFAFELAALVEANAGTAHVPAQLASLFDWLWAGHVAGDTGAGDAWPHADAELVALRARNA